MVDISAQGEVDKAKQVEDSSPSTSKLEFKFYPQRIGRDTQIQSLPPTIATVKDYIIVQSVQKSFINGQDTAMSLKDLKKKDINSEKPVRRQSTTATDEVVNSKEQASTSIVLDTVFQAGLERYLLARKDQLDQNMSKAYSLSFVQYCNKTRMQNRIEEYPDCDTLI